jgi:putative ABC transport system permease protein
VQVFASVWGVAIMVGLYSPIKGFELETLRLVDRQAAAVAAAGFGGLSSEQLDGRLPGYVSWRQRHVAKWNRGMAFVVSVCLVMGVLASLNTALSQLKDRVNELGIRKMCGASNKDLFTQLLVEGALTSTLGGAVGVACGLGVAKVGADIIGLPYTVSPNLVAFGFLVAFSSGLLASLWPATKAARLAPVEALRAL